DALPNQPGAPTRPPSPYGAPSMPGAPNPHGAPNPYGAPTPYGMLPPYPSSAPPPHEAPPLYGPPPGSPPPGGYGAPGPYAGAVPFGYGPYAYPRTRANGFAIASLVLSCCSIIPFFLAIPAVLGVIFGFVARKQIRESNGWQHGDGLATAGIIVGFIFVAIAILLVVISVTHAGSHGVGCQGSNC
ncbi:MAG TPA: DUF4190 domain-containing protein, partial [Acidimicrobiales bacterium]|nr:DUF4190 domain-containing protein [Acidimicrobiales bacterium]